MNESLQLVKEFVKMIGLEELVASNSKQMNGQNNVVQYREHKLIVVESGNCVKLYLQTLSDFGYDEPDNELYHFCEVHFRNGIFYFRRNIFAPGEQPVGEAFQEFLKDKLEKSYSFNDKLYKRYYFAKDFIFISEDTAENEYIELGDFEKLIRIKCTKMGSCYVPSNRAQRYFLVVPGSVYCEDLKQPIRYHARLNPDISFDDVLIVGSMRRSTARSWETLKQEYSETITKKLLKL